jgi:hypothetical protein
MLVLTACGGSDRPAVVKIAAFAWPEGPGLAAATRPGPGIDVPLSKIEDVIPKTLPKNPTQTCGIGAKVAITLADGRTVTYGPCKRPASIERLRQALISAYQHPTGMVTVPLVTQTDVIRAYDRLRSAGFRVTIRNGFSADSLQVPIAQKQSPPPGARAALGSTVAISAFAGPIGSPALRNVHRTVPSFEGAPASDVISWADRRGMFWAIRDFPRLDAGNAQHLFENYRVVRQRPLPGATLRPGVIVHVQGGHGFRPTPITVWVSKPPVSGSKAALWDSYDGRIDGRYSCAVVRAALTHVPLDKPHCGPCLALQRYERRIC